MLPEILQRTFYGNTLLDYLISLLIFLVGIPFIRLFRNIILKKLKSWSKRTATTIDDFLVHTLERALIPLLFLGLFYLIIKNLGLHIRFDKIATIFSTIIGVRFIVTIIDYSLKKIWIKEEKDTAKERSLQGILKVLKVIIWGLAVIFLLDNLGYRISTVIAGLGIGGVAIALAAQAVLGDLFSYFAIFFDRPFEIGDFIIVGDFLGSVEYIGIKTTRLRSLGGEQVVFSNTDLTNSRVRNYKRMDKRRVLFHFGVTYQTSLAELKEIPLIITNIIQSINDTVFDRAHFSSYGDFSLDFEIVYYVIGSDYNKYMDIQQQINFAIKEEFEKRNIEFAYPTQTLYFEKADN